MAWQSKAIEAAALYREHSEDLTESNECPWCRTKRTSFVANMRVSLSKETRAMGSGIKRILLAVCKSLQPVQF